MEFNLNHLRDNVIHISGFCGEDTGVFKLNVMSQVDTMLCHGSLIRIFQMDMRLMLLRPDVDQTARLPNIDLATFTGYAVYSQYPKL
jgi:hypothetical protein